MDIREAWIDIICAFLTFTVKGLIIGFIAYNMRKKPKISMSS